MVPRATIQAAGIGMPASCRLFLAEKRLRQGEVRTVFRENGGSVHGCEMTAISPFAHDDNELCGTNLLSAVVCHGTKASLYAVDLQAKPKPSSGADDAGAGDEDMGDISDGEGDHDGESEDFRYKPDGTFKLAATVSDFTNIVRCCRFRSDGQLLIASDDDGRVKVFQNTRKSKAVLKAYRSHQDKTRACVFSDENKTWAFSVGDDLKACVYDLSEGEKPVRIWSNIHTDSVSVCESRAHTLLTASFDGIVNVFDPNSASQTPELTIDVGGKVVAAKFAPSAPNLLLCAADTRLKLFDMRKADSPLFTRENHHLSALTSMQILKNGNVLTTATDHSMKLCRSPISALADLAGGASDQPEDGSKLLSAVGGSQDFKVMQSFRYANPVSAGCVDESGRVFLAGCVDGTLSGERVSRQIGLRNSAVNLSAKGAGSEMTAGTNEYYRRGRGATARRDDVIAGRKDDLAANNSAHKAVPELPGSINRKIVQYEFFDAMKMAMNMGRVEPFGVLCEELLSRGALEAAMKGMELEDAVALLAFITKHVRRCQPASLQQTLILAAQFFVKVNAKWFAKSAAEDAYEKLHNLTQQFREEVAIITQLESLVFD